jgi:hypothetical protein
VQINCQIQMSKDDDALAKTADEIAADVLIACGGDPATDVCYVAYLPFAGQAGTPPAPPTAP